MAVIFKCDRCGKVYDDRGGSIVGTFGMYQKVSYKVVKNFGCSGLDSRTYDLCPECHDELVKFMEPSTPIPEKKVVYDPLEDL